MSDSPLSPAQTRLYGAHGKPFEWTYQFTVRRRRAQSRPHQWSGSGSKPPVIRRALDQVVDESPGVANERRRATGRH